MVKQSHSSFPLGLFNFWLKEFTCTSTILSGTCIEHTPKKRPNGFKSFIFMKAPFGFSLGDLAAIEKQFWQLTLPYWFFVKVLFFVGLDEKNHSFKDQARRSKILIEKKAKKSYIKIGKNKFSVEGQKLREAGKSHFPTHQPNEIHSIRRFEAGDQTRK